MASAKSGAGIGLLVYKPYWRHTTRFASFLCCSLCCTSMVGRAGASQDAPVSSKAGKTNSVWFHHPQDWSLRWWFKSSLTGGCPYGDNPQYRMRFTDTSL
ncbi:ash family protein [Scandinavium goeteborgense]|uniref:ash family protein n=1 Tax=Scandinavium goeteborgense TaxID=1851514 RepID=UPI000F66D7D1|nr:ash family protein [Scandinavium goeteborgense]QKN83946.1 ash family protein [Scandinavium goeteborgense]